MALSKLHQALQPRFQIKWINGYWKIFDLVLYKDVGIFDLRKDASNAIRT
jgi:hypothetical protein